MQGREQCFSLIFFSLFFQQQRVGTDHFLMLFLSLVMALWDVFNVCLFRGFLATAFSILRENQAPCCAGRMIDIFQRMRVLYSNGLGSCHCLFLLV